MGQGDPPRELRRTGRLPLGRGTGRALTLPLFDETYSVSALCGEVRDLLNEAYFSVWVAGEVQRVKPHRSGHLYFELIEKGEGDRIVGRLDAVIWRRDLERVERVLSRGGVELAEGQQIRCRANLDFYPPFGRIQLVVREVDPVFTQGLLAQRRRQTLEQLAAAGLLERNRELPLAEVPLRLALVTSEESAAYHDFLATLRESPYGFRVLFVHAAVQGATAERELVSALQLAAAADPDCAVVIRGGGSRSDLAVFDSRPVAEAVATAPFPVLTGLGHEIDQTVADTVAHTSLKTPTRAAEFLVQRVAAADARLESLREGLLRASGDAVRLARQRLERLERAFRLAGYRVVASRERLSELSGRLARSTRRLLAREVAQIAEGRRRLAAAGPRALARRRDEPGRLATRLTALARSRLRESAARLDGWQRLCKQLLPERTLERGFTITRDASGHLMRSRAQAGAGERITTTLGDGTLISRVEES